MSNQASEFEKLQGNLQNGAKSKSKHRSSGMHDVAQKEMKLLSRINEKLNNLKEKAKPDFDITDTEDEDMSNDNKWNII